MSRTETAVILILRFIGVTGLFALPAVFMPIEWMSIIHSYAGLGELPEGPIVAYLARSLSGFYAAFAAITLYISFDIRQYRGFVRLWGVLFVLMGCLLLGIDLVAGMPAPWTLLEGPPTIAVGIAVLWLQAAIDKGRPAE